MMVAISNVGSHNYRCCDLTVLQGQTLHWLYITDACIWG